MIGVIVVCGLKQDENHQAALETFLMESFLREDES